MCREGLYVELIIFFEMVDCFSYNNRSSAKTKSLGTRFYKSKFIADIGLGIFIYIISLFIIINIGKAAGSAVTWTGFGAVDKTFGLIFGIFKGYVFCVCFFSLLNWFYPYQRWPVKTEGTYSFEIIYKGSEFLVEEFPKSDEYYDDTKEKIEKI